VPYVGYYPSLIKPNLVSYRHAKLKALDNSRTRSGRRKPAKCARYFREAVERGLLPKASMKEKLYGSHRPTNVADTNKRTIVESPPEERLRLLGSYRQGQCWRPRWSFNDPNHCVPRTALGGLDTTGHDTCSRCSNHQYSHVRDSILDSRQKEIRVLIHRMPDRMEENATFRKPPYAGGCAKRRQGSRLSKVAQLTGQKLPRAARMAGCGPERFQYP
jgi:hypothetical protein